MAVFWSIAVLMTLAALAFVLVPLARKPRPAGPSTADANLEVLRLRRREIEADAASGLIGPAERDAELASLVERAQGELTLASDRAAPPLGARRPWIAMTIVAVLVPVVAFGMYLALGTPASVVPPAPAAKMDDAQIVAMVESLAKKVKERPDDVRGWSLLARSMAALGRYDEAAKAYEHLATLVPDDPSLLADYADALGMAQGRSLAGRPYELARRALALDPKHHKALALAGTAAMDAGDYAKAAEYWRALAADLPPGSDDEKQVAAVLDEINEKAAASGKPLPKVAKLPAAPAAPTVASAAPKATNAGSSVSGSVAIAPAIATKASPGDTLFVYARAEGGSRMPLAVLRTQAASLPMQFALDDSMAMAPMAKLSNATAVRIEARVSRSGGATPQPGDLVGTSDVVKPGATGVKIVIDKVLP
jgi:cytochrome c-type biogenesis protein CcmH